MKQVARIHPVIHALTRCIDKPNEIAEYHWPADTLFLSYSYLEEPNQFNPDRWMDENFEPKKNSFLYLKYEIDLVDMSPIKTMKGGIMVNDFLYRFIS
ncbi:hypothetical protein RhiirA4_466649 [Rhizophagus irregularis]|uniref:Uncharacterized protein n=1 Tax=Rhizophagus irregularis TaxID=588596 RepID=A0A2I1GUQ5_9GLOM|nr:hypothetical protein RhiirA4_458805 [Rhizophagus irregularis]PKY50264.1 hypothetical protein RhiirA4_466649 [Rhizophagus irregularis]